MYWYSIKRETILTSTAINTFLQRAAAVSTRVVRVTLVPASIALLEMPSQGFRTAIDDGIKRPPLVNRKRTASLLHEFRTIVAKDIGYFEPMPAHDAFFLLCVFALFRSLEAGRCFRFAFFFRSSSKSNGLVADAICLFETCLYRAVVFRFLCPNNT